MIKYKLNEGCLKNDDVFFSIENFLLLKHNLKKKQAPLSSKPRQNERCSSANSTI